MDQSYSIDVGTTSVVIAPDISRNMNTTDAWTAGAVAQGDYVLSDGRVYWAASAGTSVTAPKHRYGTGTHDGINWVLITNVRDMVISADEDVAVTANKGDSAVLGEGLKLDLFRPAWELGNYTGAISAISASGTATIQVLY